ncbi:adenosine deaminase 2-like [Nasonia vitripennis]|uniref:Adenosine deaminase n=1 Tax=Nasonia vitripennis TaxID=7425 RepID=A0A7M7HA85_NASVI|nr:adenosine deaminase 2-like [Nasonia vitripennis]
MKLYLLIFLIANCSIVSKLNYCNALHLPEKSFFQLREEIIREERMMSFGSSLKLQGDEILANECLMATKRKELDEGFERPEHFLPSQNFLDVHSEIEKSEVFKIIRLMPKGAVFHAHLASLVSLDFIINNVTYIPNLHICYNGTKMRFRFLETPSSDCDWQLLKDLREKNPGINIKIQKHLTMLRISPAEYNIDVVWNKFQEIFAVIKGLVTYRPAFEIYFYQALQELYDDNVMYFEFRASLSKLYELNGTTYNPINVARIYQEMINRFTTNNPDFLGAKVIFSPQRGITQSIFDNYVKTYKEVKQAYPDFIIGFDLVGQEDRGNTLLNFAEKLIELGKDTPFFFHAGETNWYGHATDENLVDAVLLNTKRIGHGFALLKHPKLMQMVKEKNIVIELNPISNQVLDLVKDMRNHPASHFFAENYPIVVSNDDPSFWGASGLSYDFYEAFIGIMSREADLRALKQLAINSIKYSGMKPGEQKKAFKIWQEAWNRFTRYLAYSHKCVNNNQYFDTRWL